MFRIGAAETQCVVAQGIIDNLDVGNSHSAAHVSAVRERINRVFKSHGCRCIIGIADAEGHCGGYRAADGRIDDVDRDAVAALCLVVERAIGSQIE